jgi:cytochrome c-type biogenesis protein CcmH
MTPTADRLRAELQHLRTQRDAGVLDAAAYDAARAPLERQLVDLLVDADAPATRPSRRLVATVAAVALVVAAVGYSVTGSPDLLALRAPGATAAVAVDAGDGAPQVDEAQIVELMQRMEARLREQPDNADGWALLARSYTGLGRFSEAAPAFRRAIALRPDDPDLLADFADALAALYGGQFNEEVLGLVERALAIAPGHLKALALAGSAAYDRRDFATAVANWERVAASLPPDSPVLAQVRASIAQARQAGGLPEASPPAAAAARGPGPAAAPPAVPPPGTEALSGRVSLAAGLAAQVSPDDTVFIVARPADGSRMPLAVLRKQVKDLPTTFTLDDSLAMAPGARISAHDKVIVAVRVSRSGNAMTQAGDLVGESAPVAPGTHDIVVEIGTVVAR